MKNKNMIFIILILTAVFIAGCSNATGNATRVNDEIKIGVTAPLTGGAASFGQNIVAGATLASDEINAKGGVNGKMIRLIVEDDACVSTTAINAMNRLVNVDLVDAIVGPVCTVAAGPAAPIAAGKNVPMLLTGASAPFLTGIGGNIFRLYPSDNFQGVAAAEFMYNKLGTRQVAIIYFQDDFGLGIKRIFTERFEELGGEVVYEAGALPAVVDFKTDISKMRIASVDGVFVPMHPSNGPVFLKQLSEAGLDIPAVGVDSMTGEEVFGSGQAQGLMLVFAKVNAPDEFTEKIQAVNGYGDLGVNFLAPIAYDAVYTIAGAVERAGTTEHAAVIEELYMTNRNGVAIPNIAFTSERELTEVEFQHMVVRDKELVPYN